MSNINNQDLQYVINNWNKTHNLDLSFNNLKNIDISCNKISFHNLTGGNFKNTLDNSLSNIDSSINSIIDKLNNDFYTNNEIDNSFNAIYNKYDNLYNKTYIDSSFHNIDSSINSITDSIYTKDKIDISFDTLNNILDEIDNSFIDVNTKLNTIDTSMQYILDNDISFSGKKTFNNDITILGNLITSTIIPPDNGKVIITGNLQVNGTETTIDSNIVDISSKTIILASNSTALDEADGAGIEIYNPDNHNPSILYNNTLGCWKTNIGLDISGKINVKDNDFSMKVTDNSNNKLDISMSNDDYVSINGNLNVTGDISNDYINNKINNKILGYYNIDISYIDNTNNDIILSRYNGLNIENDWDKNRGIDFSRTHNIFFTSISYENIISNALQDGSMVEHLKKYNMLELSNSNNFSYQFFPNDISDYFEISKNIVIANKNTNIYSSKLEIIFDISSTNTFTGNYYIDVVITRSLNTDNYDQDNIITSKQKIINNLTTEIDISLNIDKFNLPINKSVGLGFLVYNEDSGNTTGINNKDTYVDLSINIKSINFYIEKFNRIKSNTNIISNSIISNNDISSETINSNDLSCNYLYSEKYKFSLFDIETDISGKLYYEKGSITLGNNDISIGLVKIT
jgi:hypothetical protein